MRSALPSPAGGCPDAGVAPPPAAEEGGRAGGAAIAPPPAAEEGGRAGGAAMAAIDPSGGLPGRLETHAGELPRVKLLQSGEASAEYAVVRFGRTTRNGASEKLVTPTNKVRKLYRVGRCGEAW